MKKWLLSFINVKYNEHTDEHGGGFVKTEIRNEEKLGKVTGLYCHGMRAGDFLFSTQIGNVCGEELAGPGIYEQTLQTLENIQYVLSEVDAGLDNIVKCTIYITDMNDYDDMNRAYKEVMPQPYPARACVQVSRLSPGSKVEIEFTVYLGK